MVPIFNQLYPRLNLLETYEPNSWMYRDSGMTEDEFLAAFKVARETPDFWRNMYPYKQNVEALRQFLTTAQDWCDVLYVTSRPDTAAPGVLYQTTDWLLEQSLAALHTSVIVVTNTVLAMAGSIFSRLRTNGMRAPKNPATNKLTIIAVAKMAPRTGGAPNASATTDAHTPVMTPLNMPAIASR